MPHPESEHGLRVQLATALRERDEARQDWREAYAQIGKEREAWVVANARADAIAAHAKEAIAAANATANEWCARLTKSESALAAARRECEDWRAVEAECGAVDCHCGCHVYAQERAALSAPASAAGEEGT